MKVILLQDVENVGKKYQIIEVKNGHGRNLLIPQGLAKAATAANLKWLASQKEAIDQEVEADLKKAQEMASNLDDMEINIAVKVGDEGQLFESINNVKIAEKLKEMGFEVKKSQINLKDPIKTTGEFPVTISLDHNLEVQVRVLVSSEAGEVEEKA